MMKHTYLLILMMTATILALPACDQTKTGTEKVVDNVNDALDRRPGEKVLDAAEDAGDTLKDNVNDALDQRPGEKALDAAEDAGDKLEDAGKEIKESVKDAY